MLALSFSFFLIGSTFYLQTVLPNCPNFLLDLYILQCCQKFHCVCLIRHRVFFMANKNFSNIKLNNHLKLINIFTLRGVFNKKGIHSVTLPSLPACRPVCLPACQGSCPLPSGGVAHADCLCCLSRPVCRAVNVISMIKTSTQIKRKRSRLTGPPPLPTPLSLFQPDPLCGGSIIHRRTCSQRCRSFCLCLCSYYVFFFNENINSNVSVSFSHSLALSTSLFLPVALVSFFYPKFLYLPTLPLFSFRRGL